MSADVIKLPERVVRPDVARAQKAQVPNDANAFYNAARLAMVAAEIAREKGEYQKLANALCLAFFAIAEILGIPRGEAEDYLPD